MSPEGTKRLVRMAIRFALDKKLPSVTLMHKGNIMKFTEGAFKDWGYELAREEFRERIITEDELFDEKASALRGGAKAGNANGRLLIKDRIADSMFQQIQLRPDEYSVIATPNLNGDYLSDAAAAMTGGLGLGGRGQHRRPGGHVRGDARHRPQVHGQEPGQPRCRAALGRADAGTHGLG